MLFLFFPDCFWRTVFKIQKNCFKLVLLISAKSIDYTVQFWFVKKIFFFGAFTHLSNDFFFFVECLKRTKSKKNYSVKKSRKKKIIFFFAAQNFLCVFRKKKKEDCCKKKIIIVYIIFKHNVKNFCKFSPFFFFCNRQRFVRIINLNNFFSILKQKKKITLCLKREEKYRCSDFWILHISKSV